MRRHNQPRRADVPDKRNAARALGLSNLGTLTPGAPADLAIWDINDPAELVYRIGFNPLHQRIKDGQ